MTARRPGNRAAADSVPGTSRSAFRIVAGIWMLLVDLLPLTALSGTVRGWTGDTMTGYTLLPVLVLPTVVAAMSISRAVYWAQLLVGSAVCAGVIAVGPPPPAARVIAVIATVGTLACAVVLVRRSTRSFARKRAELRHAGMTDPLTGILNRRGLVTHLPALRATAAAADGVVGIAAVDIDRFKDINDRLGHDAGDDVLRDVCASATEAVGADGLVARIGGEELLLVTVGPAWQAAERLARLLRRRSAHIPVTISAGVTATDPDALRETAAVWRFVAAADRALYRAKARGRDRIEQGGPPDAGRGMGPLPSGTGGSARPGVRPPSHRRAIDRVKRRMLDRGSRVLYQVMVGWMVLVGLTSTIEQLLSGRISAAESAAALPVGVVLGVIAVVWLGRVRTAWGLTPVLALGSLFELYLVCAIVPIARPTALMMSLVPALLIAEHWPGVVLRIQAGITATCAVLAAIVPGRPVAWTAAIAVVTAASLVSTLLTTGRQRRHDERIEDELHRVATTDSLTGLGNRRALRDATSRLRAGWIALVDVDQFKCLNDRHGHPYGDRVLRSLARALAATAADLGERVGAFRIGGDEFVVMGPQSAPDDVTRRVMAAVAALPDPVTVTVGVGQWREDRTTGTTGATASLAAEMAHAEAMDAAAALIAADRQLLDRKGSREAC